MIQGYGLTETTSLVSVEPSFPVGQRLDWESVSPEREIKLAADGEILVRGRRGCHGLLERGAILIGFRARLQAKTAGIGLVTLANSMPTGNLYFKGRKKDVIVTPAGMNVYPEDLEAALRRQPEVKDVVVIALPRDGNAEPCPAIILRDRGADPTSS